MMLLMTILLMAILVITILLMTILVVGMMLMSILVVTIMLLAILIMAAPRRAPPYPTPRISSHRKRIPELARADGRTPMVVDRAPTTKRRWSSADVVGGGDMPMKKQAAAGHGMATALKFE